MKVLSKDEQKQHYNAIIRGGLVGGALGMGVGIGGVMLASRRYTAFRSLTLPFRAFLITSATTFGAIVSADRASLAYSRDRDHGFGYQDEAQRARALGKRQESDFQRFMDWGREHRYSIVFGSWLASMGVALALVGRNKYLTGAQKLVQARVYAQGLTVLVLVASAVFEAKDAKKGEGRWETVMVLDPEDPEHKHLIEKRIHKEEYEGQDLWKDMVAAEEKRIAERKRKQQPEVTTSAQ